MDIDDNIFNIGENIKNMSIEEVIDVVDDLHDKWITGDDMNIHDAINKALTNFGLSLNNLQFGSFEKARLVLLQKLSYIRVYIGYVEIDEDVRFEAIDKFNKLCHAVVNAENAIRYSLHLQQSMISPDMGISQTLDIFKYTPIDTSDTSPKQNLLLFLLEVLMRKGYRRYRDDCYTKIYTPDGYDTHCWKFIMTLEEFIYDVIKKEIYFEMWKNLTNEKGIVKWAVDYLQNHRGCEFETLVKDRHIFAFNNGLLFCKNWSDNLVPEEGSDYNAGYYCEFINYKDIRMKKISSSIVAAKYFDIDFDESTINNNDSEHKFNNWFNIITEKCPSFNKIMEHQEWPQPVREWLCILMGRMCYDLLELEEWQIMPFLLGQAGSGKSTILTKIIKLFYENNDIGTFSNNIEGQFGLSGLANKLMFIGPEIKGNLKMEQSEFQSIISGEDVQIAEKNKTAKSTVWKIPGAIAGNEVPQYSDNAGSISRRLLVFMFNKKVSKGDTQLAKKLEKEIAYILYACIRGYLDAVNKYGSSDIWSIVPTYFKDSRDEMAETTNALIHFLNSDKVIVRKDLYCKESVFIDLFNEHCKEMNIGKSKWTRQYCMGPFETYGLNTRKERLIYPMETGEFINGNFIFGVDVVINNNEENDDSFGIIEPYKKKKKNSNKKNKN